MSDSTPGARAPKGALVQGLDPADGHALLAAVEAILPDSLREVMSRAVAIASNQGRSLWVVGGVVRDALLGRPSTDLDLMVEPLSPATLPGDDPYLKALALALEAAVTTHDTFRTAVLTLGAREHVDLAQAREEAYPQPGALPEVSPGRVAEDLKRRDFSINAMALCLVGEGAPGLVDRHGGLGDLERGLMKVLHPNSFTDDPTRLYRGARFLARLGYKWEEGSEALAKAAFAEGLPGLLSPQRLGHELEMMAREPHFFKGLQCVAALGGLESLGPVALSAELGEVLGRIEEPVPRGLLEGTEAPELSVVRRLGLLKSGEVSAWGGILEGWGIVGSQGRLWMEDLKRMEALIQGLERGAAPSVVVPILRGISGGGRHLLWAARRDLRPALEGVIPHLGRRLPLNGRDLIQEGWTPGPTLGNLLRALEGAYLDGAFETRGEGLAFARGLENGEIG